MTSVIDMDEGKYTPIRRISHSGSINTKTNASTEAPCAEIWERRDNYVNPELRINGNIDSIGMDGIMALYLD